MMGPRLHGTNVDNESQKCRNVRRLWHLRRVIHDIGFSSTVRSSLSIRATQFSDGGEQIVYLKKWDQHHQIDAAFNELWLYRIDRVCCADRHALGISLVFLGTF